MTLCLNNTIDKSPKIIYINIYWKIKILNNNINDIYL